MPIKKIVQSIGYSLDFPIVHIFWYSFAKRGQLLKRSIAEIKNDTFCSPPNHNSSRFIETSHIAFKPFYQIGMSNGAKFCDGCQMTQIASRIAWITAQRF